MGGFHIRARDLHATVFPAQGGRLHDFGISEEYL